MAGAGAPCILTIPDEILVMIIEYVSLKDVLSISLCNKALYILASSDSAWCPIWNSLLTKMAATGPRNMRKNAVATVDISSQSGFKNKYKAVVRARLIVNCTNAILQGS